MHNLVEADLAKVREHYKYNKKDLSKHLEEVAEELHYK